MKKLMRCLPDKYTPYKAGMSASSNGQSIMFDELVEKLLVHELELEGEKNPKSIALMSVEKGADPEPVEEDAVSLSFDDLTKH